ncbi:MAG: DUF6799 domain-containing protein [Chitinophagaceae bacterium]
MKYILVLFAALLLNHTVTIAQATPPAHKMKHEKMSGDKKDCVMMKDGKMMMRKDGKMSEMDQDMTMKDGTVCMKDGTCKMKNGKTMKMKDGETCDMDGHMSKMSMHKKGKMKM